MVNDTAELLPDATRQTVRRALLRWYAEEHRPLPWRTQPSEYGTVVSEFMLQQTQVVTVLPFYENFLRLFPDFQTLAEAPEQNVLAAWAGLGYYNRARLLKRTAELIVRRHEGRLPHDPKALAELPGFGEYTVGAVGSIALGLALPLVDGNVRRVLGRVFAHRGDLMKGEGRRWLWAAAGSLVDPAAPGDFNQALMDLGATVCVPREPLCLICPLYEVCQARESGYPEDFPLPVARRGIKNVREVAVAVVRKGKLLVLQRGEGKSFAGMWELPRLDSREVLDPAELNPGRILFDLTRLRVEPAEPAEDAPPPEVAPPAEAQLRPLGMAESTFTNHRIKTELYLVEDNGQAVRRQRHVDHKWVSLATLAKLPASRAQQRLFALLVETLTPKPRKSKRAAGRTA